MTASRRIEPFVGPIDSVVVVPGSKSITNRALLVAALASGTSVLRGALLADDTEAMIDCARGLGAEVHLSDNGTTLTVSGIAGDLSRSQPALYARQSGTTARFLSAALALGSSPHALDADEAMRIRPMGAAFDALRFLGVQVHSSDRNERLPVSICGPVAPRGTRPMLSIDGSVSSQFASGLLLAAPYFPEGLELSLSGELVSQPYLQMTVAVMRSFGARVETPNERTFIVEPRGYVARDYQIEPDASAASYFFAAAVICGGTVRVEGLGSESLQGDVGFVDALKSMGADVSIAHDSITVTSGQLHGISADFSQISDTAQTIAAVAVFADGPTQITGIGFIRKKETDRIAAVVSELCRLGVDAREDVDGFSITPGPTHPASVETYDDHRMAMSMSLIGLRRPGVEILDPDCVRKTFPTFFDELEHLRPGVPT